MKTEYVRCIKDRQYFTVGKIYKIRNGVLFDKDGDRSSLYGYERCFSKVSLLCTPVLKHNIINTILDKLHIKYNKQYMMVRKYRNIEFKDYENISDMLLKIYNNINLLCENNMFQLHCYKIKMMIDSIDMYSKMYNNEVIDYKGFKDIYDILCKYNTFLKTENDHVKDIKNKNEEQLKKDGSKVLSNVIEGQKEMMDIWMKDLGEFNK